MLQKVCYKIPAKINKIFEPWGNNAMLLSVTWYQLRLLSSLKLSLLWILFYFFIFLGLNVTLIYTNSLIFLSFKQDDSYIDSYISTIGVDFVRIWKIVDSCKRYLCLRMTDYLVDFIFCRKSAQWSKMERPLNFKLWDSLALFLWAAEFLCFLFFSRRGINVLWKSNLVNLLNMFVFCV